MNNRSVIGEEGAGGKDRGLEEFWQWEEEEAGWGGERGARSTGAVCVFF